MGHQPDFQQLMRVSCLTRDLFARSNIDLIPYPDTVKKCFYA